MSRTLSIVLSALFIFALVACGDDAGSDSGPGDTGTSDSGVDSGPTDSGTDSAPIDSGADAADSSAPDASSDATTDAAADAATDAVADAGPTFGTVNAVDQTLTLGLEVIVASVDVTAAAIVVIHEDTAGAPGPTIGWYWANMGATSDIAVNLNRPAVDGETLHAMLHVDNGSVATYEPSLDPPAMFAGSTITDSFVVTRPAGTPDVIIDMPTTAGLADFIVDTVTPRIFASFTVGVNGTVNDPDMRLVSGLRYQINGPAAAVHPLQFVGGGTPTVFLSMNTVGTLEGDADVDWDEATPNRAVFTVDSDFEAGITDYRCGFHTTTMGGAVDFATALPATF